VADDASNTDLTPRRLIEHLDRPWRKRSLATERCPWMGRIGSYANGGKQGNLSGKREEYAFTPIEIVLDRNPCR
jgi:hypothetical protein